MVKWHVHVVEYVYIWLAGVMVLMANGHFSEKRKNILLAFTSVCFALGAIETTLQLTGTLKTYMEKVGGSYSSPYQPQDLTWYHVWNPSHPHWLNKPEYNYWRPTNSLGFGDYEWAMAKKPKEKRIMTLGDSFTEGDGAPYDSSYVFLLNKKLNAAGDSVYMMNAGVCGSDPFMNFVLLRDRLLPYQPDVVIQALGTNDMNTDINIRGGMERFQKDGTLKYKSGPWWEPIYAVSYVSRVFFHLAGYNELLQKNKMSEEEEQKLSIQVEDLFHRYATLCKQHNTRLVIVLRPDKQEILNNKYDYDFSEIIQQLNADTTVRVIDLLPCYQNYIAQSHTAMPDYFWKHDGHHNAKGYEMMAHCIYQNLNELQKNNTLFLEK